MLFNLLKVIDIIVKTFTIPKMYILANLSIWAISTDTAVDSKLYSVLKINPDVVTRFTVHFCYSAI